MPLENVEISVWKALIVALSPPHNNGSVLALDKLPLRGGLSAIGVQAMPSGHHDVRFDQKGSAGAINLRGC